jgi:hypothetical protein
MRRLSVSLLLVTFALSANAFAAKAPRTTCDRAIRYATLDPSVQDRVNRGETVAVPDKRTDSAFTIGYIYKLVDVDAELAQAVFSAYAEQRTYLKRIKESTVEEDTGARTRVRYEADTGYWYIPNSHYTVYDTVSKDGATFMLDWTLAHSEGLTRLEYVDGYMRTESVGSRALIIYCNYAVPVIKMSPDRVNKEGLEALKATVDQASARFAEVAADQGRANTYLEKYRRRFGN